MKKVFKRIAAMGAAMVMAVSMMGVGASAYSAEWGFSWKQGANSSGSAYYTTFGIKLGPSTITTSGNKCRYVTTIPYITKGAALYGESPSVTVSFTAPDYQSGNQYYPDTISSGHKAVISFRLASGTYVRIKASANKYDYYSSVSADGTAKSV